MKDKFARDFRQRVQRDRRMDETRVLERALENCHNLERSIYESIRVVRRLNIRYNSDWLLKNYKNYMANIWAQYRCHSPEPGRCRAVAPSKSPSLSPTSSMVSIRQAATVTPKAPASAHQAKLKRASAQQPMSARSSQELSGSNRRINYKFIRIKRSMEALIMQIQHAIEIANRQKNYVHVNVNRRDSRTRICCH